MEIRFTRHQYENLLKLVYLGNWMINGIRSNAPEDKHIEKYNAIEQHIFSFAKDAGLEQYIEFDKDDSAFYPTRALEEETDIEQYRQDYDDELFWEELIHRLAHRDFIKTYGAKAVSKMEWKDRLAKEDPLIDKYAKEFEDHGIDNLRL